MTAVDPNPVDVGVEIPFNASRESEEAVIAACLANPGQDVADAVSGIVGPNDFYFTRNREVFIAVCALAGRGEPIDPIIINHYLQTRGLPTAADAELGSWLDGLMLNGPVASRAPHYARIVADFATMRDLFNVGSLIRSTALSGGDAQAALDEAQAALGKVASGARGAGTLKSLAEIVAESLDTIEDRANEETSSAGLMSGLTDLDELTRGAQPGQLIVVGARPAMGKSVFAAGWAENVARTTGRPVLLFSIEMRHAEHGDRYLSSAGMIPGDNIKTGQLTDSEWNRLPTAAGHLAELPVHIDDDPYVTMPAIRSRARQFKALHGDLAMIVVDYMQLMQAASTGENRQREIAEISADLKRLARELELPVVALAQLNRKIEDRTDKRPMLSDLKDSGSIEQDADVVMFLFRDEVYDDESPDRGVAEIIVGKQRSGETRTVRAAFRGQFARFDDLARAGVSRPALAAAAQGYDGAGPSDENY